MKIVNAVWEKKNLGLETVEITIENEDTLSEIEKIIHSEKAEYQVLKVPVSKTNYIFNIQKTGFSFIEDMILLSSDLKPVERTPMLKRFYDAVTVDIMNNSDIITLKEEIKKGLFDSDRIFLDPYFSPEQAKQRYINWIDDEINNGTALYKYIYHKNTIGFFGLKEISEKKYTSFLGGIYLEYRKGGIGNIVKVPETVRTLGGTKVSTNVSSNNPAQIRNLISNGYIPEDITHIFVRHNKA